MAHRDHLREDGERRLFGRLGAEVEADRRMDSRKAGGFNARRREPGDALTVRFPAPDGPMMVTNSPC